MTRLHPDSAVRLSVALRILTAAPLGYVSTSLIVMALARVLPGGPTQASVAAGLLSFPIYAAFVLYVFAAPSARQAFLVVLAIGAVGGAVAGLAIAAGGRL